MPSSAMLLFGAHVRLARVRRGLSKAALAKRLGLPGKKTIAAIEAGAGVGALDAWSARALAAFCGLTMAQMLGEAPPPEPRVSNRIHMHMGPWLLDLSALPGPPAAQRDTLVRIVEELGRVMRETMGPRAEGRQAAPPLP